jgi:hypothetical protein
MDAIIEDLLKLHDRRHKKAGYTDDMPELARTIAGGYQIAENSFVTPGGIVNVSPEGGIRQRRVLGAHETSHAITKKQTKDGNSYEKVIRYHHASVTDIDAHLEALADAGGDVLLMPDHKVRLVLQEYGYTGQAVWELSVTSQVVWGRALQRVVRFDEEAKIAGLIIDSDGKAVYVCRQGMRLPRWNDGELPDLPDIDDLRDQGFSVFKIPGRTGWFICLKKVDDFEPA